MKKERKTAMNDDPLHAQHEGSALFFICFKSLAWKGVLKYLFISTYDRKRKSTQFPTPFSGTFFTIVSSKKTWKVGLRLDFPFKNFNQYIKKWFQKVPSCGNKTDRTMRKSVPCKTVPEVFVRCSFVGGDQGTIQWPLEPCDGCMTLAQNRYCPLRNMELKPQIPKSIIFQAWNCSTFKCTLVVCE